MMFGFMIDSYGLGQRPICKIRSKGAIEHERKELEAKIALADHDNYITIPTVFTKDMIFDCDGYAVISGKGIIPKKIKPEIDYILD